MCQYPCSWSVVEYCFTSHQLIYGYIETDADNDDEIGRNPDFHFKDFKDKGSYKSCTTYTWYEMDTPLICQYVRNGWKAHLNK